MTDSSFALELTVSQARVLGALLEKELVTPDVYPMTLKGLTAACNQTSNRDPVLHFEPPQVETAALALKSKGLLRVVYPGSGERSTRYRQVANEALALDAGERALVSLLLLRGPQTAAELRARSDRLHAFEDTSSVETVLAGLASRAVPLAIRLERFPGQKEARWAQLLEAAGSSGAARSPGLPAPAGEPLLVTAHIHGPASPQTESAHVHEPGEPQRVSTEVPVPPSATLERRLAALEARVEALIGALGDLVPPDLATEPDE